MESEAPPENTPPEVTEFVRAVRKRHRRQFWLTIVLPMFFGFLLVAFLIGIAVALDDVQTEIIANWMMTIWILCPLGIILFAVFMGFVSAVYGMNWILSHTLPPLERVQELSRIVSNRVASATETVNRYTIELSARTAPVQEVMSAFDAPDETESDLTNLEEKHESDRTND